MLEVYAVESEKFLLRILELGLVPKKLMNSLMNSRERERKSYFIPSRLIRKFNFSSPVIHRTEVTLIYIILPIYRRSVIPIKISRIIYKSNMKNVVYTVYTGYF